MEDTLLKAVEDEVSYALIALRRTGRGQWVNSYAVAARLDADVTYVQHCLREAAHVERFAYPGGLYLVYPDAHNTVEKGMHNQAMTTTARRPCPHCNLTLTTAGECPL